MKLKSNNLQTSLQILKEVEDKLRQTYISAQKTNLKELLINPKDVQYKQSNALKGNNQSSLKIKHRISEKIQSKVLIDNQNNNNELQMLRTQNREMKKYINFLQKMNDNLKHQLLHFTKKINYQDNVQHNSPKNLIDQIQFLKKINDFQSTEIQKLRKIKNDVHNDFLETKKDIYTYITPEKINHEKLKNQIPHRIKTEHFQTSLKKANHKKSESVIHYQSNHCRLNCNCVIKYREKEKDRKSSKKY